MKVLIAHPEFKNPGGVSNYFDILKDKFEIQTEHFIIGKRIGEKKYLSTIFRLFQDYIRFIKVLKSEQYDIIHINPSLNFKGIVRDGIFILFVKFYKRKVIVFFHGWQKEFEKKTRNSKLLIFRKIYKGADAFIVLAIEFKKKLQEWGFEQPVYVVSTAVDDNLLIGFDINNSIYKKKNNKKFSILFLARIIKDKGIYETIDAVDLLKNKFPKIELIVAGEGEELKNVKDYVKKKQCF